MKIKVVILIAVSVFGIISCFKPPEFPIEPTVEFNSFEIPDTTFYTLGDTGNLILNFTDGDGDLGKLNNQDSTSRVYYRNLKDTNFFNVENYYVIPIIPRRGTTNSISGSFAIKLNDGLFNSYPFYFALKGISVDTFTFKLYITDRANHISNTIITPPIIVKLP